MDRPRGLDATSSWARSGGFTGGRYGYAVATAGDVNGDGYADVIIGSPLMTGTVADEGTARVYLGSAAGLQGAYAWRGEGGQTLSWYGNAVATAGDVNGDGYADVIVGSKDYNGGETNEGRVYVYYGNASKGVSLRPRQTRYGSSTPIAPLGRSHGQTGFRIYSTFWSPFGRGRLKPQFEVRERGVLFDGTHLTAWSFWDNLVPGTDRGTNLYYLKAGTAYHWRMRIRYDPVTTPFMPSSRWFTRPWNGWNETDFRTEEARIFLPLLLRH